MAAVAKLAEEEEDGADATAAAWKQSEGWLFIISNLTSRRIVNIFNISSTLF